MTTALQRAEIARAFAHMKRLKLIAHQTIVALRRSKAVLEASTLTPAWRREIPNYQADCRANLTSLRIQHSMWARYAGDLERGLDPERPDEARAA